MPDPLVIVAAATAATWVYLISARGSYWREPSVLRAPTTPVERTPARVAVVIPARNEAESIAQTVSALLQQDFLGLLHVFLVDDDSTDGTAVAAREAARLLGKEDAVTVLPGKPLPERWTGKVWAMSQGVAAAANFAPDFILFTDADIIHSRKSVANLLSTTHAEQLDLTSKMVRLQCLTSAERLLIPAFVYFFFMLYPPRWVADRGARTAAAAGGCMLVRPEALDRAGGIETIRGEIIDDCALARVIKRSGGRVSLSLTEESRSIRSYTTFSAIESMITRTAFNQLRHSSLLLLGTILGLLLTFIAPVALLFSPAPVTVALAALALGLMCASYMPMVRFYGVSLLWVFTLPLAALFYLVATLHSAWHYWTGAGGQWKGRSQDRGGA